MEEYTVAPIFMDENAKGAHEWVIEFDTPPADIEHFADILDVALCSVNSDYEAKRSKNTTLKPVGIKCCTSKYIFTNGCASEVSSGAA